MCTDVPRTPESKNKLTRQLNSVNFWKRKEKKVARSPVRSPAKKVLQLHLAVEISPPSRPPSMSTNVESNRLRRVSWKKGQKEKILLEAFSSSSFSLVTFFNPKKKILKSRPIFDIYQGQDLVSPTFPLREFFSNDGFFTEVFDPFSLILPMRCSKDRF